jgi:dienelactone hydrolase
VGFQSSTNDYEKFLIAVYGDKYAAESWFFNAKTKELIHQYTPRPDLKAVEQYLAPMEPIRYKSSDGLEISGYLTIPVGMEAKNLPVVVLVHGGPKGPRDYWGYDPQAQFLANRGYAVLQPNFRASGGYGKSFLNAGDLQWGKLMQDDITWGVKHLISEGIADERRVAIMGGSYGGYATLAGLAFTPDLYTCGVDIVGPSNIFTLLESVPAYWEAGRAFLYGMVGDPNTEEGKKLIQEASPLFSAEKINKPLLIIQGANDPRVKKAEADQIAIALRDRGHDVAYLLADDEGHGFAKPVNRMAMYAEIEKFLSEKMGGRYQKEMPDDVAARLAELRVDISTVVFKPADEFKTADKFPTPEVRFVEGSAAFDVNIAVQGQNMAMETTRTVAKNGEQWVVTDETKGAMGDVSEVMTYSADLKPVSRKITQMGQNIEMLYHADKVAVSAMGQNIEIPYEGALLSTGPGYETLIAGLPLKTDYEIIVMVPDVNTMKAKQQRIKVVGEEEMDGNPYWKVELTTIGMENEKTTLWINEKSHMTDQIEQSAPAMGNAVIKTTRKG